MTREFDTPRFPSPELADEEGLLTVGGQLTPTWLLAAYGQGIFPWPLVVPEGHILAWFSPDPRAVLSWDSLHIPRRLKRRLRRGEFEITCNVAFATILDYCAAPRSNDSMTWITPSMKQAYRQLHDLEYAHSVEIWQNRQLVGGLYGVAIGSYFSGESMFHLQSDASKVAVVAMTAHLQHRGFDLFDIQQSTPHMQEMGATQMPRSEFLKRVSISTSQENRFGNYGDFNRSLKWLDEQLQSQISQSSDRHNAD